MNLIMNRTDFVLMYLVGALFFSAPVLSQNQDKSEVTTDTIPAGVRGSINPLTDNNPVHTGENLLDDSFPSSWPLFGSDIRMRIGGYVKADFIRDFDYLADRYEFELGSIAVEGSPERELGGISTFHAKQTRINFDFRSKAKWGNGKEFPMQVFLELDWFFDSDAFRLSTRLRHAYGVIGRLLVGRTWTTSADLSTLPGTIDFANGDALYGGRTTQIRWQDKINDKFSYAVALEDFAPQIDNVLDQEGAARPLWPNIAAMVKAKSSNGSSIQLGLDVFPLSWKGPSTVPNSNKTGYAITATSRIVLKVTEYQDAFVWGAGYGEGQAHKIISLSWDGKASGTLTNNDLTLAPAWFAFAGYNHYWSKKFNSNISTAWSGTTLSSLQSDDTIQKAGSVHANLIYFPTRMISAGIEYMWGVRENKNGIEGTASRVQAMVKFKFN
ncbi:DcaP family trimeric outer membrane transporter [Eudoraea chungangensis]|uniref:DcaP family trimeric outer membrane transporter n=1 Tax=Eudoraea chungangensis TaxID=1481905 RepID=UPI0023EDFC24|nr:DcaP family trimeric outer membrane transporter [Eudoraea chungangensis]